MATREDTQRAPSPAVDRALTVLERLVDSEDELTLTALAQATRIPLATCAAILYTLERRGYASRRVVGRSHFWRPTLRLYGMASQLVRKVDLSAVAQPDIRLLAEELGMPVHVGVLDGAAVVYVAKAATPGFIQFDTYPGKVAPFNLTALGRAIAAHLPPPELDPLLAQLVAGRGPRATRATRQAYIRLLRDVQEVGYAVEDEEEQAEIACIAAPFFDAEGRVAGSVGVTGFSRELMGAKRERAVGGVLRVGREMSRRMGCPANLLPSSTAGG